MRLTQTGQNNPMIERAPESRTMQVGAGVTPTEKRAIELVATVDGRTVADLLRPAIDELVVRGRAIADRLKEMEAAAAV